jgi:SAM-dependent methyltransferase
MTAAAEAPAAIRSTARPRCPVCGGAGVPLHGPQPDRLFHAPGQWRTARCATAGCDAAWLDPAPLPEDLPLAYVDYYTHSPGAADPHPGRLKRGYRWLRDGFLARRYGYACGARPRLQRALGGLLYLAPLRRASIEDDVRRLPAQPGGRLLDVGCGAGDWLCEMRARGWAGQGVDVDAAAVETARARGLDVRLGSLEAQAYPDGAFDAVTLNHVVEHLPDAAATLRECRRVLRPGGMLVVATPNGASLGHALFGTRWRGLEPPRHLQLFGPRSLAAVMREAGLEDVRVRTANSAFYWRQSLALWRCGGPAQAGDPRWTRVAALALALGAQAASPLGRGESLVAHATRR